MAPRRAKSQPAAMYFPAKVRPERPAESGLDSECYILRMTVQCRADASEPWHTLTTADCAEKKHLKVVQDYIRRALMGWRYNWDVLATHEFRVLTEGSLTS